MHHDLSYVWEKFFTTTLIMSQSEEPLAERLIGAYLGIHTVNAEDMPTGDLQQRFRTLKLKLTKVAGRPDDGSVRATVTRMDPVQIRQAIEDVVSIYNEVAQAYGRETNR